MHSISNALDRKAWVFFMFSSAQMPICGAKLCATTNRIALARELVQKISNNSNNRNVWFMQFLSHSFAVGLEYDSCSQCTYINSFVFLLLSLETKKSDRRTKEQSIQNWKENTTPLADVNTENDIRDKYRERIIKKKLCIYYTRKSIAVITTTHTAV